MYLRRESAVTGLIMDWQQSSAVVLRRLLHLGITKKEPSRQKDSLIARFRM